MTKHPATIGRYEIVSAIGRGGMGALYRAWDPKLDRHLAIKLLNDDNDELRERFAREARSAARLRHPHIVTIFDVGEDNGRPFIAMEFVQGQTLADLIRSRAPLVTRRKLQLIEELCDGLAFAHKAGIVHRDVKPANVMVDVGGELKILDFGIARIIESASMTRAGALIGTLNYMSPEQIAGRVVDHRSDIFAVGAVLYELLAYRQAFPGGIDDGVLHRLLYNEPEPLTSVCREVDPDVERIVSRCLEKNPDMRYSDLGSMLEDLQRVQLRLPDADESTTHIDDASDKIPGALAKPNPTPTPDESRRRADREELDRRRVSQIQTYLDLAQKAISSGDYDAAIVACEEVLLRDAQDRRALELLERAKAALDERQAEEWLVEAERELRRGALTAALTLIERAEALSPSSTRAAELRRTADEALRERERARQRAEALRQILERAHALFDKGLFRDAQAAADEALALDPNLSEATTLKSRAADALEAHERAELERRARESIREARRLFSSGDHGAAVDMLARFEPQHQLVSQALDQLRAESARLAEQRRLEAERRAKQQRIAAELLIVRNEMGRQQYADALNRLQGLADREGNSPEMLSLTDEAKAGQAELDRIANIAREVAEHVARAAGLFARNDLTGALSRIDAALALDAGHGAALTLRSKIQESLKAAAKRREAEERRVREREQAVASALGRADRAASHESAIAALQEALEIDPNHAGAQARLEQHREALAREEVERRRLVEEQNVRREHVQRLVATARQAFDRRDLDAARHAVRSALEVDPENPDAQFLSDDIATVELERRDAISHRAPSDEVAGDAESSVHEAERPPAGIGATSQAAELSTKTPDRVERRQAPPAPRSRSHSPKIYVIVGAATAIAVFVAIGFVAFRGSPGDEPRGTPIAPVATTETTPSASPVQPGSPTNGPATVQPTNSGPSTIEVQLTDLRARASAEFARGDWQRGLVTATAGLKLNPEDSELKKVLADALGDARSRLARERDSTITVGQSAVRGAAYQVAGRKEQEASRLARAGQTESAVRAYWQAVDLYRQAGTEGRGTQGDVPSAQANTPPTPPVPSAVPPTPAAASATSNAPSSPTNISPAQTDASSAPAPAATSPPPPSATPSAANTPAPATSPAAPAPSPVAPPNPPPPAPAVRQAAPSPPDEPAIRAVLAAYASAYSALDPTAVKRVYPSANEQVLRRAFSDLRSQQVQIQDEQISVGGLAATVSCTVVTVFQGQAGALRRASQRVLFRLEKRNGTWIIVGRQ